MSIAGVNPNAEKNLGTYVSSTETASNDSEKGERSRGSRPEDGTTTLAAQRTESPDDPPQLDLAEEARCFPRPSAWLLPHRLADYMGINTLSSSGDGLAHDSPCSCE
ncbi:hypothetical protein MRB53_038642 [Persea americana]|nr:hypothetical protein MRB53_038642 [Persea americana]